MQTQMFIMHTLPRGLRGSWFTKFVYAVVTTQSRFIGHFPGEPGLAFYFPSPFVLDQSFSSSLFNTIRPSLPVTSFWVRLLHRCSVRIISAFHLSKTVSISLSSSAVTSRFVTFLTPACSVLSFSFYFRVTSVFHQVAQQMHSFPTSCNLSLYSSVSYLCLAFLITKHFVEWWGAGMVICLERRANDLHMVQLVPLSPSLTSL